MENTRLFEVKLAFYWTEFEQKNFDSKKNDLAKIVKMNNENEICSL